MLQHIRHADAVRVRLGQHAPQQVLQLRGHRAHEVLYRRGFMPRNGSIQPDDAVCLERQAPRGKLEQADPKGPHVRGGAQVRLLRGLLRGQVRWRARWPVCHPPVKRRRSGGIEARGAAEVCHLDGAPVRPAQQQVAQFDVSVHHAQGVQVAKPARRAEHGCRETRLIQDALHAEVGRREVAASSGLHHHMRTALRLQRVVQDDLVDAQQVVVRLQAHGDGLPQRGRGRV
mmetsp:Transcript_43173/g.108156  ORF Transcript_43173/g.108156 Transcript_43173/m.108156 type:complete len:230 (+) Transcript_43173:357-1046(+)